MFIQSQDTLLTLHTIKILVDEIGRVGKSQKEELGIGENGKDKINCNR